MRTLEKIQFKRKQVLVRCDFNVSISENGKIGNDFRIQQAIPTIKYLVKNRAKIILLSHLGRPKPWLSQGNSKLQITNSNLKQYSLKPIAKRLEKLLKRRVFFTDDCIGEKVEKEIEKLKPGKIILLENLRFYKEEEENDRSFAKKLANLADIYINDAFSASHRAHSSIVGIAKFLPSAAGLLLEKEVRILEKIIKNPKLPLVAIFGGREGNFKAIDKISKKADFVLINWLVEKNIQEKEIKLKHPEKIIKPIDFTEGNFDIGEKTTCLFKEKIFQAKTIFWSGPLGQIEKKEFSKGTKEIAKAIIKSKAFSVVGGGETIEFINRLGLIKKFSHISTGGSAMLEFLAGEKLPGIEVLI
jgi:3-phosphoglycerate kinase